MNRAKTKWMRNAQVADGVIWIGADEIEQVSSYIYLGQELTMDHAISRELARRCKAGWVSYASIATVVKTTNDQKLRAQLFNSTVLPAMIYGSETWSLTKADRMKLSVTERAIERRMIGVTRLDHVTNEQLRRQTQVKDVVEEAEKAKLRWAGHLIRRDDGRWTRAVTEWWPQEVTRPLGRPPTRWSDSIRKEIGANWAQIARDRREWARRCSGLRTGPP
jgi:hypothetical protein